MKWLVGFVVIATASAYLYVRYRQDVLTPPPIQAPAMPPAILADQPQPMLSVAELAKIKKSAGDPDAGVRWSALELLFTFHDPDSVALLEKAIAEDPDPDLKMKAIKLLKDAKDVDKVPGLVRGLRDTDRDVKLASLKALGEVGDPAATPWVMEALKDSDADVKVAALQTLGKFEDKRTKDFQALAAKLRQQYEDALTGAKKTEEKKDPWNLE